MLDNSTTVTPYSVIGATQLELEQLYSKHQLIRCINNEFREAGFEPALEAVGIPADFGIALLTQIVLHKRASIEILVGLLKRYFGHAENPAQACADMILKACEEDVVDWDQISGVVVLRYDISADVKERIDRFQYPMPMIEEPRPVTHNRETGYRTIKKSLLLRDNHHEDDICLDHINRLNRMPLSVNQDTLAFVRNSWKNLDARKPEETHEEFEKRKAAFAKYDETSRDVIDGLLVNGTRLWLTHAYDKRGRTYCQGYHVTYQGNAWNKACIEFADAEPLNQGEEV